MINLDISAMVCINSADIILCIYGSLHILLISVKIEYVFVVFPLPRMADGPSHSLAQHHTICCKVTLFFLWKCSSIFHYLQRAK